MSMQINNPYPPQKEFYLTKAKYIAYGGARGGGKSHATRTKATLLAVKQSGIQILLLRRKLTELRENHIIPLRKELIGIARYKEQSKEFIFPNGSRIVLGYCSTEADVLQYQGQAYDVIFMEEATQFTEFQFQSLTESNRTSPMIKVKFEPRMYLTCNPGGIGHNWVKRLFIDRQYRNKERADDYVFIRSTVYDNAFLLEHSPDYVRTLENLPEKRKKAMLYGDWDVFEGKVFEEFIAEIKPDNKNTHAIRPFEIPANWQRYRSFDWGYSKPFSVGYWAISPDGILYRYAEIYGCDKDIFGETIANTGVRYEPSKVAKLVKKYEDENEKGNHIIGVADPSIFDESRGSDGCISKIFEREGIFFEKGDNKRLAGKLQIHNRLAFDENGLPRMYIFNTCKDFIRTIQLLIYDNTHTEDIDTSLEDHIYDETRYMCMRVPIEQIIKKQEVKRVVDDPLDLFKAPVKMGKYDFEIKY